MKWPKINKALLPFKIHYFFKNGGGAYLTFLAPMAHQRGISSKGIGVIWTVHPFVSALCNIAVGSLADAYRMHRALLVVICGILASSYTIYFFLPSLPQPAVPTAESSIFVHCNSSEISLNMCFSRQFSDNKRNSSSLCSDSGVSKEKTQVESSVLQCISDNQTKVTLAIDQIHSFFSNEIVSTTQASVNRCFDVNPDNVTGLLEGDFQMSCDKEITLQCKHSCEQTNKENLPLSQLFGMVEVWMTAICVLLIYMSIDCSSSLADTMCLTVLGKDRRKYGKTRLFGAIGWGSMGAIMGSLVNAFSKNEDEINYTPAMVITASFLFFNLVYTSTIKVDVPGKKKEDKGQAIKLSFPLVSMLATAMVQGAAMGMIWTFEFIYIKIVALEWDSNFSDTSLLQGLCVGMDCIVGEVPFMFFSAYMIKKLSNIHTFTLTLAAMSVRLLFISFIRNPWVFLVAHLLHGLSFGVFFPNMVSFANLLAPLGSQATMQSIALAFFTLGKSSGSLVGGILMEKLGGSEAFMILGFIVTAFTITHIVVHILVPRCDKGVSKDDKLGEYHIPVEQLSDGAVDPQVENECIEKGMKELSL